MALLNIKKDFSTEKGQKQAIGYCVWAAFSFFFFLFYFRVNPK